MLKIVTEGFPDTNTCLLHQKLQMLNICIQRRTQRESQFVKTEDKKERPGSKDNTKENFLADQENDVDDEENDEEFFDCDEVAFSASPTKAEGRLHQLRDLKLLDYDEPLYIPMTQEPVPKTEDQLKEDTEIMLRLGPGSGLNTQMMCSTLLSDMQAFKAANPKCKIDDFIRWYSPKDWEENLDDEGNCLGGVLSERMTAPGNTWQYLWDQANPEPIWRQKRLFDDTSEAVKVLQYLESRSIGDIYALTIIPTLHAAILKLQDIFENAQIAKLFESQINFLLSDLCRLSRDIDIVRNTEMDIELPNPQPIIKQLQALEKQFYQYKCFERFVGYPEKLDLKKCKELFEQVLKTNGNCRVATYSEGDTKNTENKLVLDIQDDLAYKLITKEYVIRANVKSSAVAYVEPQFMRAIVTGEGLRLCGAFTESTAFI